MTPAAASFLLAAALLASGDWVAVVRRARRLEYVCKPGTLAALVAAALALHPVYPARREWFVAALVLSLAGDVLLMLPSDLFVEGLAAFLVAHVAYVAGLRTHGGPAPFLLRAAVPVVIASVVVGRRILIALRERGEDKLVAPVSAYVGVISVMVVSALASRNPLASVGAALFYCSDAMIAWNRFVRPFRGARPAIIVTYHLAQAGLVLSLVRR